MSASSLERRPPEAALRWAAASVGAGTRIVRVRRLRNGSFHANSAVDLLDGDGRLHRLVLRRWARPGWQQSDAEFDAHREAAILDLLAGSAVPVPELVAADPDGAACNVPSLLITRLPGRPPRRPADLRSFLAQLAEALAAIHAVDGRARSLAPPYRRYYQPHELSPPSWSRRERLWARAIEAVAGPEPDGVRCFIHRDYHPGNTLWRRGRLTGVVDWSYGSFGPASVDLGHMRWNLAVDYGLDVADEFLERYRTLVAHAVDDHAYWDLVTVLDLVGDLDPSDPPPKEDLSRLEEHVARALASLPASPSTTG